MYQYNNGISKKINFKQKTGLKQLLPHVKYVTLVVQSDLNLQS